MVSRKLFILIFIAIFSSTTHAMQEMKEVDVTDKHLVFRGQQVIGLWASPNRLPSAYGVKLGNGHHVVAILMNDTTFRCREKYFDKNRDWVEIELDNHVFYQVKDLVTKHKK
jgi:hypothetical protein